MKVKTSIFLLKTPGHYYIHHTEILPQTVIVILWLRGFGDQSFLIISHKAIDKCICTVNSVVIRAVNHIENS